VLLAIAWQQSSKLKIIIIIIIMKAMIFGPVKLDLIFPVMTFRLD